MSLKSSVTKGDWIRCKHLVTKAIIEAEAGIDLSFPGSALLPINLTKTDRVIINVNYWDVWVLKKASGEKLE